MTLDLFTPVVEGARLHPNFLATIAPSAAGVRAVIKDWADGFKDRDGKFVIEFQTTFNSSFWELYLFAVLKQRRIRVDFGYGAPDFVSANVNLAIEAAIASHAKDAVPEWKKTIDGMNQDGLELAYQRSILRLSNAFLGKEAAYLSKYKALPHMKDRSYIIAIANYGTQDFHLLGDVSMQRLLYDVDNVGCIHKDNGAPIQLGLFRSDDFRHVSGVLYSSLATFGKARALGNDAGQFVFQAIRIRNNVEMLQIVAEKKDYKECLTDGLRLYTNPFAEKPLELSHFDDPGVRKFVADRNGQLATTCHPDGDLCMRQVIRLNS